jgi:hypothetical protein
LLSLCLPVRQGQRIYTHSNFILGPHSRQSTTSWHSGSGIIPHICPFCSSTRDIWCRSIKMLQLQLISQHSVSPFYRIVEHVSRTYAGYCRSLSLPHAYLPNGELLSLTDVSYQAGLRTNPLSQSQTRAFAAREII